MRVLDRQSGAGLCADIVNLRPEGPREEPYWVPVRGATLASDIGIPEITGRATAEVSVTTLPRPATATLRLTYDGQTYSTPFVAGVISPLKALIVALANITSQNGLPFAAYPEGSTKIVFVAAAQGTHLNGRTVQLSGSTGATFTTGVFTGGTDPDETDGAVSFSSSRAAFYFERKDGAKKLLSLNSGVLALIDVNNAFESVNVSPVYLDGYSPNLKTVMSATQLDDIIAVGLSEDDVPKSLTYLYDGVPMDMDPPELPPVTCRVVRLDPTRYKAGLEPGWYGVRIGWRLTDGRVVNLSTPSVLQIRKEYLPGSGEGDEDPKYYTYHLEFETVADPALGGWGNLISGVAVFLSPRADTSLVDDYDPNTQSNVGGNSGYTDIVGAKVTYYGKTAYTLVSRSTEQGCEVTFRTVHINQDGDAVFPFGTPGSALSEYITIDEDMATRRMTINVPVGARYATAGPNSYPEPFTVDGQSVFNAILSDSELVTAQIGEKVSPDGDKYVIELITGTNPGWHPPGQMAGQTFTVKVPKAAGIEDGDPVDEGEYQSRLSGKEHSIASSLYYDIGSVPFDTGTLSFKETEEVLLTYPISEEDNVVNQHRVKAAIVTSYNKQLVLGNTSIDFARPKPNSIRVEFDGGPEPEDTGSLEVTLTVKIMAGGKAYYRQGDPVTLATHAGKIRDSIIAYPDRRAVEMAVTIGGQTRRLRLTASKRNNFAYAVVRGLDLTEQGKPGGFGDVSLVGDDHAPNRVMVSETFNPHVFRAKRVLYGDNQFHDAIRGFGVNALPVASGQFGAYPVYVLCKNSVWALEQGSDPDIAFARKAPVSVTHGLVHPYALCNAGQTIVFASHNGVHTLVGGRIEHISEPVDKAVLTDASRIRLGSFESEGRREIWVAVEGSIFVWTPKYGTWHRLERNRRHFFTDGRRLLSVDMAGLILDESQGSGVNLPWSVITRPIHWGQPDMAKRVFRIALRHGFAAEPDRELYAGDEAIPFYSSGELGYQSVRRGSMLSLTVKLSGKGKATDELHRLDIEYQPRYNWRFRS
jgi:hypothetical protein